VEEEFQRFVEQHTRQWQGMGKPGHFAAWPHGETYNRTLVQAQARRGRVGFFQTLVDGKVVSSRYTYHLGKTLYSELPSRETGEPWDKAGIGGISLMKFIELAIEAGIGAVDSGLGSYEHKASLGGDQIPVGIWRLRRRGVRGLKARGFLAGAKVILLVFQKLWYRRILPRLPRCFGRTQCLWWLRYDT
jgi:CelD/BcsL family acetyltransferase involved in cellulose biosynthesis